MDKYIKIQTIFLFWLMMFFPGKFSIAEDGARNNVENPKEEQSVTKTVDDIHSLVRRSALGSWDKVKFLINKVQKQFFPPNLDFRSTDEAHAVGGEHGGAGDRMKEAAEKSFGKSKVAVEESAKSVAKAVGEAVHKTAEKMKDRVSRRDDPHDEL